MESNNRLKEIRQYKGFSQQDVADRLGITSVAVCHMENKRNDIRRKWIPKLCEMLDCTLEELFGVTDYNPNKALEEKKEGKKNQGIDEQYIKYSMQIIDSISDSDQLTTDERLEFLTSVYKMVYEFFETGDSQGELIKKLRKYKMETSIREAFTVYMEKQIFDKKDE